MFPKMLINREICGPPEDELVSIIGFFYIECESLEECTRILNPP